MLIRTYKDTLSLIRFGVETQGSYHLGWLLNLETPFTKF